MLATAEQCLALYKMHAVDESGLQVLADYIDASAYPHIFFACRCTCLSERAFYAVRYKIKRRAALHHDRLAGVMSQYEYRNVIGRIRAPPAFPVVVWPGAAHRTEHIAPEDPRPEITHAACGK